MQGAKGGFSLATEERMVPMPPWTLPVFVLGIVYLGVVLWLSQRGRFYVFAGWGDVIWTGLGNVAIGVGLCVSEYSLVFLIAGAICWFIGDIGTWKANGNRLGVTILVFPVKVCLMAVVLVLGLVVFGQVGKAKDETEGDNANQGLWALAENVFTVAVLVGVITFIRNLMPQSPMIRSVPNETSETSRVARRLPSHAR